MRILHVSESLDPAHGGTPAVPKLLGAAQAALGHEVTILTRDEPSRADAIRESLQGIPGSDALRIETVAGEGGLGGVLNRAARRWAHERRDAFDFAHLHSMWSPIPHGAARGLERAGIPYCVCPHGMLDDWSMSQSALRKRVHLALVSRRTMASAAFVHALNEHEADCVRRFAFGSPVEVLGNGINPEMLDAMPAPGAFRAAYPVLGDDPFILFLSRLHHKKGLDLLARAFLRLVETDERVRLVVVGPDGGARGAFERDIAPVADRVLLTGPLYGSEKLAALADAAAFCLPSRQEGFSVAICEAMAAGLPVVISGACHFPEAIEAGAGRLCDLDPASIADGLRGVLAEEGHAMGEAGRRLVMDRYTWPAIAGRSVALYDARTPRSG